MKTFIKIVAVFVLCQSSFALAGKIVTMDAQQAILATEYAKQRSDELKRKSDYAKMVAEAEALKADLAKLNEEAQSKGLTWSEEQQADFRKKVQTAQTDFQFVVQKIQKENEALMQSLIADGQNKLSTVLEQLIKSEDIDMVLRREAAYIALPTSDITAKVVEELNKLNKAQ